MGFHPEFTGRENARMNAALLGLSGPEIRRRLPEIRDFAELGEFFDRPVRTYSSGMALRLAFAVATHADADVLIVDEALAVGDGYFQKKSVDRITEFHRRGGTLLFCSHALYYVALLCDSAIWLKNGEVAGRGAALPVVRAYEAFLQEKERAALAHDELADAPSAAAAATDGRKPARLTDVLVHDGSGYPRAEFAAGETLAIDVAFETEDPALAFHVRIGVDREDGVQTFALDTRREPWAPLTGRRHYRLRLLVPELPVSQGEFRVYAYLGDEKALHVHDLRILKPGFTVASRDYVVGLVAPRHIWLLPKEDESAARTVRRPDGVAASS
jgi:lipopolysaccharide transport system ATP-binding protein